MNRELNPVPGCPLPEPEAPKSVGQIYPDSLFENYFALLRQLACARLLDVEDYVSARDEYLMVVKNLPPEFGYKTWRLGDALDYSSVPSGVVDVRRKAAHLLPLEIAAAHE